MLTFDDLELRRAVIGASADLGALRDRLRQRAQPVLDRMPPVPAVKALLSRDGGVCPVDGTALAFDPWSPDEHRCPNCGQQFTGERHHAHWAHAQHLWLAERAAHLAALHAITGEAALATRARQLLAAYYDLYFALPNRDNVLGPTHLFFSTYLESIWILDYLAAAYLLRETGQLDDNDLARIDAIADEAATIISEFNEGLSNRQTWNSAALTAIATWFGDEELAVHAIEGRTGLMGHLGAGFGDDGLWYEGENYHLFAMRGLLIGLTWAQTAGAESIADKAVRQHLGIALMAPAETALPDRTFPARKDARFGVSLAHPAYIESWEAGLAMLGTEHSPRLSRWLHALYDVPPVEEQTYDCYLHDAGLPLPPRSRAELSWWALLTMTPALPDDDAAWQPTSTLMAEQELAIIHSPSSYLSLECGNDESGGHGHPDRLHLTLIADGVRWLVDPGTGSYVTHDLFWYRSTLAHNAPRLNGQDQSAGTDCRPLAFEAGPEWSWVCAVWGDVQRRVVHGPAWTLDLVTMASAGTHELELPVHLAGSLAIRGEPAWSGDALASEFVTDVVSTPLDTAAPVAVDATCGERTLTAWFAGDGILLRAEGPGRPDETERRPFLVRRVTGSQVTFATLFDRSSTVTGFSIGPNGATILSGDTATMVATTDHDCIISSGNTRTILRGAIAPPLALASLRERPPVTRGQALSIETLPPLDGSLHGFDCQAPLRLNDEHHYHRSELPYPGTDRFAATAWVNWCEDELLVAVDVRKHDLVMPPVDAPPLLLDNEPEDINADGVQIYSGVPGHPRFGWLIRPLPDGTLAMRAITGPSAAPPRGAWQATSHGYRITVALPAAGIRAVHENQGIAFDLFVNEMYPDRQRRAGQLIWSHGPGWVYLRGDRHALAAYGELAVVP
ncbi:MAG TPA: heparinase II/III family protein [Gemmatimonadales bacterium]|jgi:hypothetical protein